MGAIVSADARIAHIQLDKTVRSVTTAVRESFHELGYIRTAQRVATENLKLVEHLRKVGETAYAQDRAAHVDMIKAQAQLGQIRYDQILLADLEQTETARLNGFAQPAAGCPLCRLVPAPHRAGGLHPGRTYHRAEANQDDVRWPRRSWKKPVWPSTCPLRDVARLPRRCLLRRHRLAGRAGPPRDAGRDAFGFRPA